MTLALVPGFQKGNDFFVAAATCRYLLPSMFFAAGGACGYLFPSGNGEQLDRINIIYSNLNIKVFLEIFTGMN
ncbi:MAG: hypothetical protein DWQ10_16435 [Calditrichaeota bacterium]|nr:MAG: hypothetical protein DWQ10_16435 [Calditrichota bacterium]